MITLAVMTGISAEQWAKEGARAIATAFEVLETVRGVRSGPSPESQAPRREDEHPNKYGG